MYKDHKVNVVMMVIVVIEEIVVNQVIWYEDRVFSQVSMKKENVSL